ncbi:MAG: alpha/beta hydrolase-fold protein, partial [Gemmatimonadota bacterium]
MRPLLLAAVLAVAPGAPLSAQDAHPPDEGPAPVVIGETITIRSEILGEDRRIHVQLPDGYEAEPDARYPVLYVLDGAAPGPFTYVGGLVGFLSSGYQLPRMIVVGVPNIERTRDLTSPRDRTWWFRHILSEPDSLLHPIESDSTGGADAFLDFLTEELAPQIDRRYRTAPFRVLMGHSLSGFFATRTFLTRPESFHAYIASSPTLIWNDRELVRNARHALAGHADEPRFFYAAVGDREDQLLSPASELAAVLEMHAPPGLRWWYRANPGETHQSNPVLAYAEGLKTVFQDVALSEGFLLTGDLDMLEARLARASETYGYAIVPSAEFLNLMGASQLMLGRTDAAIQVLERSVELHPSSAGVRDGLAAALEAAGRSAEALERSEEAVRRATAIDHPQLE